jgi:hypothetical protein
MCWNCSSPTEKQRTTSALVFNCRVFADLDVVVSDRQQRLNHVRVPVKSANALQRDAQLKLMLPESICMRMREQTSHTVSTRKQGGQS